MQFKSWHLFRQVHQFHTCIVVFVAGICNSCVDTRPCFILCPSVGICCALECHQCQSVCFQGVWNVSSDLPTISHPLYFYLYLRKIKSVVINEENSSLHGMTLLYFTLLLSEKLTQMKNFTTWWNPDIYKQCRQNIYNHAVSNKYYVWL